LSWLTPKRRTPAHRAKCEAGASTDVGLLGVVTISVLLTAQRQVAPYVRDDLLGIRLRSHQGCIPTTVERELVTGIDGGFSPCGAITLFLARPGVAVGEDTKTRTAVTDSQAYADCTASTLVRAVEALRIGAGAQIDVLCGRQQQVGAGLKFAALYRDVAPRSTRLSIPGSNQAKVTACRQIAALADALFLYLLGAGLLSSQRNRDTDELACLRTGLKCLGALISLIAGKPGLNPL